MASEESTSGQLPRRILLLEDELTGKGDVLRLLEAQHVQVSVVGDVQSALYALNNQGIEVAVLANEFQAMPGMVFAQKIRAHKNKEKSSVGIIVTTNKRELKSTEAFLQQELGGVDVLKNPYLPPQILPLLKKAQKYRNDSLAYYELNDKLINFYRKNGNIEKAIEQVRKHMSKLGERGPFLLMDLYHEAKDHSSELAIVESMIERKGDKDIRLINRRGSCLMSLGRMEEAQQMLEKADELAPLNIERMKSMAEVYIANNEPEKSVAKSRQVISLTPDEPDHRFSVYNKLIESGFGEHARDLCSEISMPEEIVRYYNNKGVAAAKVGAAEDALKLYDQALFFYPKSEANYKIFFNQALAEIHLKKEGFRTRALGALERCLDLNAGYEKALELQKRLQTSPKKAKAAAKKKQKLRKHPQLDDDELDTELKKKKAS